jgi:hypothetical protein
MNYAVLTMDARLRPWFDKRYGDSYKAQHQRIPTTQPKKHSVIMYKAAVSFKLQAAESTCALIQQHTSCISIIVAAACIANQRNPGPQKYESQPHAL